MPADRTLQGSLAPDAWAAIGDPTRRAILERLAERPWAVGELAGQLPVSRPAVSSIWPSSKRPAS